MALSPIHADSTPEYNPQWSTNLGVWSCADWMEWFYLLVAKYGQVEAVRKWCVAWDLGISWWWDSVPVQCPVTSDSFRAFADSYKPIHDLVYKGFRGTIYQATAATADVVEGTTETIGDIVENIGDTVSNTTKTLKWAVPVVIVLTIAAASLYAYNYAQRAK